MPRTEWTYEDYASLPDDGNRYEVIDGEIYMIPSPGVRHQIVAANVYIALHTYVEAHSLGMLIWDVDLLFVTGQFLRPDMLFVPKASMAGIGDRGVETKPGLVIEIMSSDSREFDRNFKPGRYRDFGVDEYWVVDTVEKIVEQYRLNEPAPIVCYDVLDWRPDPAVPALELSLDTVFGGFEPRS